jgi:hypothetical protein
MTFVAKPLGNVISRLNVILNEQYAHAGLRTAYGAQHLGHCVKLWNHNLPAIRGHTGP